MPINLAGTRFGPGDTIRATYQPPQNVRVITWRLIRRSGKEIKRSKSNITSNQLVYDFTSKDLKPDTYHLQVFESDVTRGIQNSQPADEQVFEVADESEVVRVALDRAIDDKPLTKDPLIKFEDFQAFLVANSVPSGAASPFGHPAGRDAFATFSDDNYQQLKSLSRAYVRSITFSSLKELAKPYILDRMRAEPVLPKAFRKPFLRFLPGVELIWNFWEEAGMLVQTLNLILARFQNRVAPGRYTPLDRFDVTPLATLHALLYAFVDDEQHRMTVRRRAAEYEYEYGLTLIGKAIPPARSLVERRSGFLEAFHHVLHQAHVYFKEDDDLTVTADAFPLYRSLRECHLELSQGSHNQFGQLAVAARAELLQMQFLLAQPEMREFLGGRPMTPYTEPWMDRVDRMKEIQPGWPTTSIMHFHDLASIGERLVLTIRLGSWADDAVDSSDAKAWADLFREPIQKYVASYRAVTGVDLSQTPDATQPAALIRQRVREQRLQA